MKTSEHQNTIQKSPQVNPYNPDLEPGTQGISMLPPSVKGGMESAFQTDFSNVNIHTNSASATNLNALAFTQGNDIHFAPGQFNPSTIQGRQLIGHELTHVIQQSQGNVQPTMQAKGVNINNDPDLEKEADELGKKAAEGQMVSVHSGKIHANGNIQMKCAKCEEEERRTAQLKPITGVIQCDFATVAPNPDATVAHETAEDIPEGATTISDEDIQDAITYNSRRFFDPAQVSLIRDVLGLSDEPAIFDEDLIMAIMRWQAEHNLDIDGKMGGDTSQSLANELTAEGALVSRLRREGRRMAVRDRPDEWERNTGTHGFSNLFDAHLSHENALLTLRMKVKFNFTGGWPDEDSKQHWQDEFVRLVQRHWSYKYGLMPDEDHANKRNYLQYYRARIRVIPVTSGEHWTANVQHTTTHIRSQAPWATRVGSFDSLDINSITNNVGGVDYNQVTVVHEFGHMMALYHIDCTHAGTCPGPGDQYGDNETDRNNIMGWGMRIDEDNYYAFTQSMNAISGFRWKVIDNKRRLI